MQKGNAPFFSSATAFGYRYYVIEHIQSVASDHDCFLVMLFGSCKNGRVEVTQFSVFAYFGRVSAKQRPHWGGKRKRNILEKIADRNRVHIAAKPWREEYVGGMCVLTSQ